MLQVALDRELSAALEILEKASAFVDIIEIGTPLIFREGMHAVRAPPRRLPGPLPAC